ncbi:MAG: discoidin domain-containing protein [Verrucomicrobia bacterium]|nr:discoidin domain-containing protein [Verrucomicrobiota bacterium]
MKSSRRESLVLALALAGFGAHPSAGTEAASAWTRLLETEWLLEAQLRAESQEPAMLLTRDDAAGGCDGVMNGQWGFHTAEEENPWWQVDLGEVFPLAQVRIWNRSDSEEAAKRARHFRILISNDGENWRQVHQHDGILFYGYHMPDRSALVVKLANSEARFVRVQLPGKSILHLDEVEVIRSGQSENVALRKPADQSSLSPWSRAHPRSDRPVDWIAEARRVTASLERMMKPADGTPAALSVSKDFSRIQTKLLTIGDAASAQALYLEARALQRRLALASPLLDFDAILFTKRVPGSFNHMSDQYYGWWSRPGGGIYLLRGFASGDPATECLTDASFKEPGSFLRPALSFDARKILFAWCKHYPELAKEKDKLNKANVPEDAFYHIFEMNLDGSGVRRLTRGKYDNFDARYLPDGRIVFLSTRRGQALQVGKSSAAATLVTNDLPDCYVRCGGDASRPVAVYTLHTMNADGGDLTPISPFEMFEWEPSVAPDGTILYSRWDYVDRDNMPYMSVWSINPDGTNARLVYGNYTQAPHCAFEPRGIPGSRKFVFTASGHHSQTMGSLVLLDPAAGTEGKEPVTRLTPATPFPEIEGWPRAFYANPWPLSERSHLVSWGVEETVREGRTRPKNGMGLYLFNAGAGLELLYRDPEISSMYPIPVKAQPKPPVLASSVQWDGPQEGRFLVADVTRGLTTLRPGEVKALRIVAIPAKTQPWMNQPGLGLTRDDPGKAVLGTVPVEADGSAYFRAPSGVALFFQALDGRGLAVQTMRSATHVQPGQTLSCTGCHDSRKESPPPSKPLLASLREPSRITVGPEGSWTMRFDRLIQPVLDAECVRCHNPDSDDVEAGQFDLTPARSYHSLTHSGHPSLNDLVLSAYRAGVSAEGQNPAMQSSVLRLLADPAGHFGVHLNRASLDRFSTWMDTYAQRAGVFSSVQERELERLRLAWADLLIEPAAPHAAARRLE